MNLNLGHIALLIVLSVSAAQAAGARIQAVYPDPGLGCAPANLLRFYIEFSEPMQRGQLLNAVSLRDASGRPVRSPFLNLSIELWNQDQTVATLFLDPGRTKRGVGPNLSMGPPLREGASYQLEISDDFRAAASDLPIQPQVFKLCVSKAVRRPIENIHMSSVKAGSRDPLHIIFDRLIDLSSTSYVHIQTTNGETVSGKFRLSHENDTLIFQPDFIWKPTLHRLVTQDGLEDVSGNRFCKAMDSAHSVVSCNGTSASFSFIPG